MYDLQLVKFKDRLAVISEMYSWERKAYVYHGIQDTDHTMVPFKDLSEAVITKKLTDEEFQVCGRIVGVRHTGGPTSGTDPEIFAFDKNGDVIPAWLYLPKKQNNLHGSVFWDGVQAELTTAPCGCHAYLADYVREGLLSIHDAARHHTKGAVLKCQDVVPVPTKLLVEAAEEHVALGCAPSNNVYTKYKSPVINPRQLRYRFAGCHQHFSATVMAKNIPWWPGGTVRMMDRITGPFFTALGRDLENPIRRKYYGRPGEYRLPGSSSVARLEYRTPGAFFLQSPQIFNLGMDVGRYAFKMGLILDGKYAPIPDSTSIVKNCDADKAAAMLKTHSKFYLNMLEKLYKDAKHAKHTLDIAIMGLQAAGLTKASVAEAWKLDDVWGPHNNDDKDEWAKV